MRRLITWALSVFVVSIVSMSVLASPLSASLVGDSCDESGQTTGVCEKDSKTQTVDSTLKNIVDFLLVTVGVLAAIMVIVSGIKIMTSAGDANKLAAGKRTLLYSIAGLAVSVLAFAIVNLVINEVSKPGSNMKKPATQASTIVLA